MRYRFDAMFDAGVASYLGVAGPYSSTEAMWFGYNGTDFGCLLRLPGANPIWTLTVTAGTSGAETITITLDGTEFSFSANDATTAGLAEAIAEQTSDPYTGWNSAGPLSRASTVVFVKGNPGTVGSDFTMESSGVATGTFAETQVGAANTITAASGAFVAQTSWNIDRMDGTSDEMNPSGMSLDPQKLNTFEVVHRSDAGCVDFRVMTERGDFVTVHRYRINNTRTTPWILNPSMRVGWVSSSLGSTTDLSVYGTFGSAFLEGPHTGVRDSFAVDTDFSAGTTEYVALALRVSHDFNGYINQREMIPLRLFAGVESSTKLCHVHVYLNPTLTGALAWTAADASSCVDQSTPTTLAPSGGTLLAAILVGGDSAGQLDLQVDDLRLEPGDVLAVAIYTVSGSSNTAIALEWAEG
jgi:hypothetical protein